MGKHRSLVVTVALGGMAAVAAVFAPIAGAARPRCLVVNTTSDKPAARTLQAAVDSANAGDKLVVKGTCLAITTINTSVTITGQANPAFGTPTLDGGNPTNDLYDTVNVNNNLTVVINNLTITGGGNAGGLYTFGGDTVTLTNVSISNNNGGGGIYNAQSTLTLINSTVSNNYVDAPADWGGGGIYNSSGSTLTLANSTVSNDTARMTMAPAKGLGGGIDNAGTVTLTGSSTIHDNHAAVTGGGIYNNAGGTLAGVNGANVFNNTPNDIAP